MKKINFNPKIGESFYFAEYFNKTARILDIKKPNSIITMQWFQREKNSILCGIEIVKQMLSQFADKPQELKILSLKDGDLIQPYEPVLKITGKYSNFAKFEGMIDGILARCTTIATNARNIVNEANGKEIIDMNDRTDFYTNQNIDGYASYIGGIKNFVTKASIELIDDKNVLQPQGTMPHSLIQSFNGDIIKACEAYCEIFPDSNLVALVDYNNDCVNDALKVARYFKNKLFAVRLDTSDALVDISLLKSDLQDRNGVNPHLVKLLRSKLDEENFNHVKIIVSSGFDANKIRKFEKEKSNVDYYGVGSALNNGRIQFTGDAVMIDGKEEAKIGRTNVVSDRLKIVKL